MATQSGVGARALELPVRRGGEAARRAVVGVGRRDRAREEARQPAADHEVREAVVVHVSGGRSALAELGRAGDDFLPARERREDARSACGGVQERDRRRFGQNEIAAGGADERLGLELQGCDARTEVTDRDLEVQLADAVREPQRDAIQRRAEQKRHVKGRADQARPWPGSEVGPDPVARLAAHGDRLDVVVEHGRGPAVRARAGLERLDRSAADDRAE